MEEQKQRFQDTNNVYRAILDSVPLPIFLVQEGGVIVDYNLAAAPLCGTDKDRVISRRGGEVLKCIHSHDVVEGCGYGPACRWCGIRNSVNESMNGIKVTRRRVKAEFAAPRGIAAVDLLVTTSPVDIGGQRHVSLVLEDITDISGLSSIIPICAKCKKIRDDQEFWNSLESFFHKVLGVDFSHSLCPECFDDAIRELDMPGGA